MLKLIWSVAQRRVSRRKLMAVAKTLAGVAAAALSHWLVSRGIEVDSAELEQGLEQGFTLIVIVLAVWLGGDGVRDWRNRNAEDKRESNGPLPFRR